MCAALEREEGEGKEGVGEEREEGEEEVVVKEEVW